MANPLPVKNLIRLNLIITFMSSIIGAIFLITLTEDLMYGLYRFLEIVFFMGAASFCNLILLKIFSKQKNRNNKLLRIKFYLSSYISVITIWMIVKTTYTFLSGVSWEGDKASNIYRAYLLALLGVYALNSMIIILQKMVVLQHRKSLLEIESLQLKANVSESSNLLLRQQIHPHFLFNALTTVKSLYRTDIDQGEEYLVHLSNFLRVSITNHVTTTTLVLNELDFCMDYLKMQKIRFGNALEYSIELSEETLNQKYLPYFSLQPLVENAIKHNDLTEDRPLKISISEKAGYLTVSNKLQQRSYKESSTGQGLSNLAERYHLLGEEGIEIASEDNTFSVRMKILNK